MNAWRLSRHESLASTSDTLIALAEDGEAEYAAIVADNQTGPRGSRGRAWTSLPGALNLSVLLRPHNLAPNMLALMAGVALWDAIMSIPLMDRRSVRLKWPNDVQIDHAKVAGILVETAMPGTAGWAVIGFGVNLAQAPDLADRTTTCIAAHAAAPDAMSFAHAVLDAISAWYTGGVPRPDTALRQAWLDRSMALGTPVRFKVQEHEIEGRFAGLGPDGALWLDHDDGCRTYAVGEILTDWACCSS